ncbi:hypothetical protein [Nocardia carnea]|uniref:Lipoprotein n=1 Tax=Nocardia carnea TaxID=37328 RepID=A0ABW7TRI9_9NOCA|nr:hypothetical protein [Nocardia carnea]
MVDDDSSPRYRIEEPVNRVRVRSRNRWVAIGTAAAAAVTALALPGCGFSFDRIEVIEDDSSVNAAFQQVLDSRMPARLGDVIDSAGLPFDSWDRMYTFHSPVDSDEVNSKLGTDVNWRGLPGDSDSAVQVFMNNGEAVGAYVDTYPRHSVGRDAYATPESAVTPVSEVEPDQFTREPTTVWFLEIEETG